MDRALIVTHPTSRFGVDEDEVVDYLEESSEKYDEIFYVSAEYDPSPGDSLNSFFPDEGNRSDLPPGFDKGFYRRGLTEETERTGSLHEKEAEKMSSYDKVEVAGGWKDICVSNTLESLPEEIEKEILEPISYGS